MKIIVGLGNPENLYKGTRHNAGFFVLDRIALKSSCDNFQTQSKLKAVVCKQNDFVFAKPAAFMNNSGESVRSVLDFYKEKTSNLYVIHDDLDLELGTYKIQYGTGPHGHNGLLSVYQHLGNHNFWHVRVGVDSRSGNRVIEPSDYVLKRFSENEKGKFEKTVTKLVEDLHNHIQMKHSVS